MPELRDGGRVELIGQIIMQFLNNDDIKQTVFLLGVQVSPFEVLSLTQLFPNFFF